jgi:hypothetical protein
VSPSLVARAQLRNGPGGPAFGCKRPSVAKLSRAWARCARRSNAARISSHSAGASSGALIVRLVSIWGGSNWPHVSFCSARGLSHDPKGWRVQSEILPLTWDRIDLEAGTVRLYRGTTKNKDGRIIDLPLVLRGVLEQQRQEHLVHYPACPYVFPKDWECLFTFYKAWRRACKDAGLSGKLSHDFRRTAVRNLVRAGVPERGAMMVTGHKIRDVFDRYNIVSDGDLEETARRVDERIVPRTTTLPYQSVPQPPVSH